jgi:hypothetical protein
VAYVFIKDGAARAAATVEFEFSSWNGTEYDLYVEITVKMTGSPSAPVVVRYATSDG